MQDPQSATAFFFGPVAAAFTTACCGWLAYDRLRGTNANEPPLDSSDKPVRDFVLAVAAAGNDSAAGSRLWSGLAIAHGQQLVRAYLLDHRQCDYLLAICPGAVRAMPGATDGVFVTPSPIGKDWLRVEPRSGRRSGLLCPARRVVYSPNVWPPRFRRKAR